MFAAVHNIGWRAHLVNQNVSFRNGTEHDSARRAYQWVAGTVPAASGDKIIDNHPEP